MSNETYRKVNEFINRNIVIIVLGLVAVSALFVGRCDAIQPLFRESRSMMDMDGRGNMMADSMMDMRGRGNMMMAESADVPPAPMMARKSDANVMSSGAIDKKIVKSGNISVEVKDAAKAKAEVEAYVIGIGGYVDSFYSFDQGSGVMGYNINTRVPSDKLDEVVAHVSGLGSLKNEGYSTVDLTEQYSDVENQLKNLYARRNRLRDMMNDKTAKLADVLSVDRELTSVQSTIESLEKRNRSIDRDVAYSSLQIGITQEVRIEKIEQSQWKFGKSWKNAVNKLVSFLRKAVDFLMQALVFLPIILIFVFVLFIVKKLILFILKPNKRR